MRLKTVALVVLGTLIIESLLVVVFTLWLKKPTVPVNPTSQVTAQNANTVDQVLKEKLDRYSSRAEDLQKMVSLLLTLTTIYAIVLGVSAYTNFQNNLQQADKGIERLDRLVKEQEATIAKHREEIPKRIEEMQKETTYTRRIAIATAISQFPPDPDNYQKIQETVVETLLELRNGDYGTDIVLNQQLARLYVALGRYSEAEQVMTRFIAKKRRNKEIEDRDVVTAYYDRACYRSLRLENASPADKIKLKQAVKSDLTRVFDMDHTLRSYAKKDKELKNVESEDWFLSLSAG